MNKSRLLGAVCACLVFTLPGSVIAATWYSVSTSFTASGFSNGSGVPSTAVPTDDPVIGHVDFYYSDEWIVPSPNGVSYTIQDFSPSNVSLTINGFAFDTNNLAVDLLVQDGIVFGIYMGGLLGSSPSNQTLVHDALDFYFNAQTADRTNSIFSGAALGTSNFVYRIPLGGSPIFEAANFQLNAQQKISLPPNPLPPTPNPPSFVPIPAAAWLFSSALAGLFGVRRMKKQSI